MFFYYRGVGRRYGYVGCRCYRVAIFCYRRTFYIGDFYRAGDYFFRRYRFIDIVDLVTEYIDRVVREADFIGTGIVFIKLR